MKTYMRSWDIQMKLLSPTQQTIMASMSKINHTNANIALWVNIER